MKQKTWTEKLYAIQETAVRGNFSDEIDDIETLVYTDKEGRTYEDRFDYIDTTTLPTTVCFIGGTGHGNFSVPIGFLTQESIDTLYECINR